MIGSIHRTDAEPDALLWWSVRAQETAAKAAGDYGRKHRQQKTEETEIVTVLTHTYYRVKYLQERKEKPDFDEIRWANVRRTTNRLLRKLKAISPHQTLAPKKFFFSFLTPFGRGVHAPASNLEAGYKLPMCSTSPNT